MDSELGVQWGLRATAGFIAELSYGVNRLLWPGLGTEPQFIKKEKRKKKRNLSPWENVLCIPNKEPTNIRMSVETVSMLPAGQRGGGRVAECPGLGSNPSTDTLSAPAPRSLASPLTSLQNNGIGLNELKTSFGMVDQRSILISFIPSFIHSLAFYSGYWLCARLWTKCGLPRWC